MWPFRKKTAKDYIKQFVRLAKYMKKELSNVYDTANFARTHKILRKLRLLDKEQFYKIKEETHSKKLMDECEQIHSLVGEAISDIENKYKFDKAKEVVDRILSLEHFVSDEYGEELKEIPSKELKKVLAYSPREAISHGVLYRGMNQHDYNTILKGDVVTAVNPQGHITLTQHILDDTNNPNTQFISLTADPKVARHFSSTKKIIALRINKLNGALLREKDIKLKTGNNFDVLRLVRKNSEFILAPSRLSVAKIGPEAVIK